MIELEFKINKEEVSPKSLKSITKAPNAALQVTYFLMPVRFEINGEDPFYYKGCNISWHDMPIIDFATTYLEIIKILPLKKKDSFIFCHEGYEDMLLEMMDKKKVRIFSGETKKAYIVDYDELLKVFEEFEKKVKKFLNENAPQLKEHPYWGSWIKGESVWVKDKGLVPIKTKRKPESNYKLGFK